MAQIFQSDNHPIQIEMAAAAVPVATNPIDQIPEFVREIFYPSSLSSFRESMPTGEIEIYLHRRKDQEPTRIRLINMFPFMTLKDIKIALYLELNREPIAIPEYVYLCLNGPEPGKLFASGQTAPLDFSWNFPGVSTTAPFRIANPFDLASGVVPANERFVDSGGERRLVSSVDRERMTIEDACFKRGVSKGLPILHAYLYTDLLAALGGNPPSEKEWNGRLYPMFPSLSIADIVPSEQQKAQASRLATIFLRRQQFMVRIESILEREVPIISLSMAGIKTLQLTWEAKKAIQGVETQFYEANVNERRPFIRLIPTEGTGISKVFLHDGKNPDIRDPKLLVQWAEDRSPTPDQDFVFAKIMLRKGLANVPPIYATLRLFNDGTADCVVEPPKNMKKLEPRNDLESFGEHLVEGLENLSYINTMPELTRGNLVLGLRLRKGDDAIITPRILRERLPVFSSMFQEITPLPGEKPMVMLRFKLVSNFAREDRIQTFLTQVIHRKVLRGEGGVGDLVALVADEFQISEDEARKQVAIKLQAQGEVAIVVPETREYMKQNNPGIDVAIFAQHPFYTFHLYNVNSLENMQRIVTALSILMSVSSDDLEVGAKAVQELATAERITIEEEAKESAEESKEPEAEGAPTGDIGGEELPDYLDFFAFDKDEAEMTLQEEHEQEVAAVARTQGVATAGPLSEPTAPGPKTNKDLKQEIAAGILSPSEELAGIEVSRTAAAPAAAAPAAAAAAAAAPAAQEEETAGETGIANFFLTKLKEADSRLFDYTKSNPSLKRYVSQCQPTYGRQPAVLSEEKFIEMKEEYAKDSITFREYPIQPGEPEYPEGIPEKDYYTVLKYGSSPQRQNYYLCCRFFCTRDEILVREIDLYGENATKMRRPTRLANGTINSTKKPGQCPFCRGTVITNRRAPGPNQTILERVVKPPTEDKRHLFIGFIKKTPHPEGFYLPCCFTEDLAIKFQDNRAFDKYREWGLTPAPKRSVSTAAAAMEDDEETIVPDVHSMISYEITLNQINKKYIVGAEKLPLDISQLGSGKDGEAQIGLLPDVLNKYFNQDPTELVSRAFNPQKLKPDGHGFLRVAVENRHRFQNDSFIAAIAPFYGANSAEQMKRHIMNSINPKEFLALNYGNLAIEFYDPAESIVHKPTTELLRAWASRYLMVDMYQENEEAIRRAYISYRTFQESLQSDKIKKEYRQFGLLCAQSNILRKSYRVGITFIVLDILKNGTMKVRCPPYGFNAELMNKNDVAFILHHWSGIWEPIFYADNRSYDVTTSKFTLSFQYAARQSWPAILEQRLSEFITQCSSSGRATYTSQSNIHSLAIIPASLARITLEKEAGVVFKGILRDSYNHIGALLFSDKLDPFQYSIAVPVVDDGELIVGKSLVMDWEDDSLKPAPIDQVLRFYKKYIETRFSIYPGFSPVYIIKSKFKIEALQLRNGLYIPVAPPSEEAAATIERMPTRMVDVLEWTKNHEICLEERGNTLPGEKERMDVAEFQEIFEHLRFTFSNWLATKEDGGEFRKQLEHVIFSHNLPLFEKRKRMEILLRREIDKWITTEFADEGAPATKDVSLLRVDCRVLGKEECGGRCVWKQENDKCMLHVPNNTTLGEQEKSVSAPRVLLLRLIEELLRYSERSRQLLEHDVSRLANLERPLVIPVPGTSAKQVIYPEKSTAWYELLRLEWAKLSDEGPKFIEEMGRERGSASLAPQMEDTRLSESLITILNGPYGTDPKTGAIRILRAPFESLLTLLRISTADIGVREETTSLDITMLNKIVQKTRGTVAQIDIRQDPPILSGRKPFGVQHNPAIAVFIITNEGPGLLVLNPETPEVLKKNEMPRGLVETINNIAKSIFPKANVGAAAPPPPIEAPPPPPPSRPEDEQLPFLSPLGPND